MSKQNENTDTTKNTVKTNYEYHMKYLSSSSSSSCSSQNSPTSAASPRPFSPESCLTNFESSIKPPSHRNTHKRKIFSDEELDHHKYEKKSSNFASDLDESQEKERAHLRPSVKMSENDMEHCSMTKANIEVCKGDVDLNEIECFLETDDLWKKFHDLGTEMIITKSGR